jgi:methylphosphotriester-DNA--protein-cysteine methyltransferase
VLPEASSQSFWLKDAAWQFPDFENVETFVERLVRAEVLAHDALVAQAAALVANQSQIGNQRLIDNHPLPRMPQFDMSPRTVRHRFLRATGVALNQIYQIERAQHAAALLQQGTSILDTVEQAGYFDQPHLTRALKQWVGHTPAQLIRAAQPA